MEDKFTSEDYFTPYSNTGTSKDAALSMRETARILRDQVLHYIVSKGKDGATDQEISLGMSLDSNTSRPRRWELYREGKIKKSGRVRKTTSGRDADVWIGMEVESDLSEHEGIREGEADSHRLVSEDGRAKVADEGSDSGRADYNTESV
jgi:hypothetical protein